MLERLYSPTGLFQNHGDFTFHPGINVVLGKYSEPDREKRRDKGINGIGKSSVVRLVSYLLASDRAEKLLADRRYDFLRNEDHAVTLELDVRGTTLVVQRHFADKSGSVRIGHSAANLRAYSHAEAKTLLSRELFPREHNFVLEGDRFRSLMHFFVKDDLDHQRRSDPLNFFATTHTPNEREKLALNFFLLGIPNQATWTFDQKVAAYNKETAQFRDLAKKIETTKGRSLSELRAEVAQRQQKALELRSALDRLDLLEGYRDIEATLTAISVEFSEKSAVVGQLSAQLRRLRRLSEVRIDVDREAVVSQFEVFSESLGAFVKKQLDDVLAFRKNLAESRTRFHEKQVGEIESKLQALRGELFVLDDRRSGMLRILNEKGALQPLRATYEQLLTEQGDLDRELRAVHDIEDIQRRQASLDVDISVAKQEVLSCLESAEDVLTKLRTLYRSIAEDALGLDDTELRSAYFDIAPRRAARRDATPVEIKVELPRSDALGRARFEIVAYDLTVFLAAIQAGRKLPDFLIHDGVFHGTSRRTIVSALNFIHRQHLQFPSLQYLVTFNEDEIPLNLPSVQRDGEFDFDLAKATVATFTDEPSGMIFGRRFD